MPRFLKARKCEPALADFLVSKRYSRSWHFVYGIESGIPLCCVLAWCEIQGELAPIDAPMRYADYRLCTKCYAREKMLRKLGS